MMILDKLRDNARRIDDVGRLAIDRAREAGVAAYYNDKALPGGVVKEMPDGRRFAVRFELGQERVGHELPPRE